MARNRADTTRRRVLKTGGALAVGALLAGCSSGGASNDEPDGGPDDTGGGDTGNSDDSGGADFGGWFDDVSNYDGVVDETGKSEVTVQVGVEGNNGPNAFDPPALRVDTGTTVVWEWTGQGSHNVVAEDGAFESSYHSEQGATFEHTFSEAGTYTYACTPHKSMGMKGAVVVE